MEGSEKEANMVQVGPQGHARVITHEYAYRVSEDWVQDQIDAEGIEPPRFWAISFDLPDLPDAGARRRARLLRDEWLSIEGDMELPEPTEDVDAFLDLVEKWLSEKKREQRVQHAEEVAETEEAREEQTRFQSEMDEWIAEKGSERLRLARERGYKVTSGYAKERASKELPQCWVDTANRAAWRERVDPSTEALQLETAAVEWLEDHDLDFSTEIVWLVEPPSAMVEARRDVQDDDVFLLDFEQQEAILISPFLSRYNVFLPVDKSERAPVPGEDD